MSKGAGIGDAELAGISDSDFVRHILSPMLRW